MVRFEAGEDRLVCDVGDRGVLGGVPADLRVFAWAGFDDPGV